jgi:hypothetical protein
MIAAAYDRRTSPGKPWAVMDRRDSKPGLFREGEMSSSRGHERKRFFGRSAVCRGQAPADSRALFHRLSTLDPTTPCPGGQGLDLGEAYEIVIAGDGVLERARGHGEIDGALGRVATQ